MAWGFCAPYAAFAAALTTEAKPTSADLTCLTSRLFPREALRDGLGASAVVRTGAAGRHRRPPLRRGV